MKKQSIKYATKKESLKGITDNHSVKTYNFGTKKFTKWAETQGDMNDDKIRASLIKMVQEQPRCGVHSEKQAEIVVDDILINRMDEIREVLARTERKKECQE